MRKHQMLCIGICAILSASILLFSSCSGLNGPNKHQTGGTSDSGQTGTSLVITASQFPKPPTGTTYSGYKITWTDAKGQQQEKTITKPEDVVFEGGIKAGTTPSIIPLVQNEGTPVPITPQNNTGTPVITVSQFPHPPVGTTYSGYKITWTDANGQPREKTITKPEDVTLEGGLKAGTTPNIIPLVQNEETTVPVIPQPADWNHLIEQGIDRLAQHEWEAALNKFGEAYHTNKNNTTATYYALVKLATISTKPDTVHFMRNSMGFETYPEKLNALINLEWFKDYEKPMTGSFQIRYSEFTEIQNQYSGYVKVKGRIVETGTSTGGKPVIDLYGCYESNTIPNFTADKWVEAGAKQVYDQIQSIPKNQRKYHYDTWQFLHNKQLVIDEVSESGTFMVSSWKLSSMSIPEGTKRYNRNYENWEWIEYDRIRVERFPQVKESAWYKAMHPISYMPGYLIEHSSSRNVDQLIDELYSIIFGSEYNEAKKLLNNLDSSHPVIVNKKLLQLIGLDNIFGEDTDAELQKEQLLGIIGGFTLAKGCFEFLQSYSFNTDLSILKFNWQTVSFDEGVAQNINGYNVKLDPFNNGFLKGRNEQKIRDSKNSFIEGTDLLLGLYNSFINDPKMPQDAKNSVKEHEFIKTIITEVRNAIQEGRKANFLIGEGNMMKEAFTTFELDMGKIFTYEYLKLSNAFEMNGNKPKIFPAENGKPAYMKIKYQTFLDDFMKIVVKTSSHAPVGPSQPPSPPEIINEDISQVWDGILPLEGPLGEKIKNFYN